jgi:hypothetical protein
MTITVATKTQSGARHWRVAAGAFIAMIGASIVLSGLLLITAPIISDLYYQKDAAGKVLLRTLPSGAKVPVEINGGQGAFLVYFSIVTLAIVISLMFFAGRLLAKYGSRVMLVVGGVIMTVGLAFFASSTGNLIFFAGAGLGYGMSLAPIPPALVSAWFVTRRGLCSASSSGHGRWWPDLGKHRSEIGAVPARLARRHLDHGSRYGGLHDRASAALDQEQAS